uniref:AraC family transcriptional regulator n=1 Tax=Thermosporothrix sp. COM3 TaxID=2490863 RepID=A0A455SJK3_9CHLR|nr:AraC family transcriptional regulator [Thermosporothrix sp. COM3]
MKASHERTQNVFFLLVPGVHLLDMAGPAQVFDAARALGAPYRLFFCGTSTEVRSAQGVVFSQLASLPPCHEDDLIIIPGMRRLDFRFPLLNDEARSWLQRAAYLGVQIASVCTGAFALGEAGLLNGRRCTTHWRRVEQLQQLYPEAHVLDAVLFVRAGPIVTSAGIASGIDMALALLEHSRGPVFAAQVARELVVYMRRNSMHAQTSVYLAYRSHLHSDIHRVQEYLLEHPAESISLKQLAAIARLSVRSLTRAFKEATGITLIQYQQQLRMELAATYLQATDSTVEEVATKCGFEDVRHFRRLWRRQFGAPPSLSRQLYRTEKKDYDEKRRHSAF